MLNNIYISNSENAYILAGAPCSGKSYILKKILNNNNKIFSIDEMKKSIFSKHCKKIRSNFINETGIIPENLNLYNYNDVNIIHNYFLKNNFRKRVFDVFFNSIKSNKRKPTIFFDTTLRKLELLDEIKYYLNLANYKTDNIFIIWIFSSLEECLMRNKKRKWILNDDFIIEVYYDIIKNIMDLKDENLMIIKNIAK